MANPYHSVPSLTDHDDKKRTICNGIGWLLVDLKVLPLNIAVFRFVIGTLSIFIHQSWYWWILNDQSNLHQLAGKSSLRFDR